MQQAKQKTLVSFEPEAQGSLNFFLPFCPQRSGLCDCSGSGGKPSLEGHLQGQAGPPVCSKRVQTPVSPSSSIEVWGGWCGESASFSARAGLMLRRIPSMAPLVGWCGDQTWGQEKRQRRADEATHPPSTPCHRRGPLSTVASRHPASGRLSLVGWVRSIYTIVLALLLNHSTSTPETRRCLYRGRGAVGQFATEH